MRVLGGRVLGREGLGREGGLSEGGRVWEGGRVHTSGSSNTILTLRSRSRQNTHPPLNPITLTNKKFVHLHQRVPFTAGLHALLRDFMLSFALFYLAPRQNVVVKPQGPTKHLRNKVA